MKKIISYTGLVGALMLLVMSASAYAAEFRHGKEYNLATQEAIVDNLYAAGGALTIEGPVGGDLTAAGGNILVSGPVGKSILAAGGNLTVTGNAGGSIRLLGGNVTVSGSSGNDLVVAGGNIEVTSAARVGNDAVFAGGHILMNGAVGGNIKILGGDVVINGPVQGSIIIKGAKSVVLGDKAVVNGSLSYASSRDATIASSAIIKGGVIKSDITRYYQKPARGVWYFFGIAWLMQFLAVIAASLVLFYAFRAHVRELAVSATENFWTRALLGFIYLIAMPVAVAILFMTLIGIPLAILGVLSYVLWLIVGKLLGGIVLGSMLYQWFSDGKLGVSWQSVLLGAFAFQLIGLIPIAGWIVVFVFFLAGLGSIVRLFYERVVLTR